jgi:hypothetical protein
VLTLPCNVVGGMLLVFQKRPRCATLPERVIYTLMAGADQARLTVCTRVQLPHMYVAPTSSTVPQPSSPAPACLGYVSHRASVATAHTGVPGRQANRRARERCHVGRPPRRVWTVPMRVARQRGMAA